ncbi:MAG: type III polyketide synthase [Tunicatimonas sp.]
MNSYISAIGTAVPDHQIAQRDIARFMADTLQLKANDRRRLLALYRATGIAYRYSVLADYGQADNFTFFPNTPDLEPFPDIQQRMQLYQREAVQLSHAAATNCLDQLPTLNPSDITHLIYVSCTGMYAPGVDIELIHLLGLNTHTQRTAVNFMGCYAAFNALKVADSIVRADPDAKVLLVCTELCSIHFQKGTDEDTLLANALFADGSAAALVSGDSNLNNVQLQMERFYCDLAPDGQKDMAWHIGNHGFEMRLSSYVPQIIKKEVQQIIQHLLQHLTHFTEDNQSAPPELLVDYYAIHPGGKRILQVIEEVLSLENQDNYHAYQVLRQYGNMSSPTILFVLQSLMANLSTTDRDKSVLGLAFGPGLTLESMLLRVAIR